MSERGRKSKREGNGDGTLGKKERRRGRKSGKNEVGEKKTV